MGLFFGTDSQLNCTVHIQRQCAATFPNTRFGTNIIRGVFMTDKKQDLAEPFSVPGHLFSVNSSEHLHFTQRQYNPSTTSLLPG